MGRQGMEVAVGAEQQFLLPFPQAFHLTVAECCSGAWEGKTEGEETRKAEHFPSSTFYPAIYLPPVGGSTANPTAKQHCLMKVEAGEREQHGKVCSIENGQFLNRE